MTIEVRILCPVQVERDGAPVLLGAQARAVLALLILHHGRPVSQDQMIDALWTCSPPRSARVRVQGLVSALRRILGERDSPIVTEPAGYVLRMRPSRLDLHRFAHALESAEQALDEGRRKDALRLYGNALDQWSGVPCGDVDLPAIRDLVEPLQQRYADVLEDWAELALDFGAKTVPRLYPALAQHPFRERMRGLLMLGLHQAGRSAEALAVYEDGRRRLAEELGVEPAPALQEIYHGLLAGTPPGTRVVTAGSTRSGR